MTPPMQTPQTLLILLAQVSTTENLLNQIWQIVYLFNWEKNNLKKYIITYSNHYRKSTILMISENSKSSDTYWLLLILMDKMDLRRCDKRVALSALNLYNAWQNIKKSYKNNTFKISKTN